MAYRLAFRRVITCSLRPTLKSSATLSKHGGSFLPHQSATLTRPVPLCTAGFHTTVAAKNEFIVNIQDKEDFNKQVLSNSAPVVVDFHAGWCGPCKLLGPRLESLIASKEGKVILAKIDVDDHGEIAMDHQVEAVPTVLAVKDGKVLDKFVGLKEDPDLEIFINKLIGE